MGRRIRPADVAPVFVETTSVATLPPQRPTTPPCTRPGCGHERALHIFRDGQRQHCGATQSKQDHRRCECREYKEA